MMVAVNLSPGAASVLSLSCIAALFIGACGSDGATATASSGATEDPRTDILAVAPEGECIQGQKYACACPGGAGTKVCIVDDGQYTECGCPEQAGWPEELFCGDTPCPYLIESDQQFTGQHCCMDDGRCGVTDDEGFGDICYPVHAEPPAVYDFEQCPAYIDFVQTEGCCRSDNQCGWVLTEGNNLDQYGCVEQRELARRLDQSIVLHIFLTNVKGLPPDYLKQFQSTSCVYDPEKTPVDIPGQ